MFSRTQAYAAGYSAKRIRRLLARGEWTELAPRVYALAGVPRTTLTPVWSAVLTCGADAVASHLSAAMMHGMLGATPGAWVTVPARRDIRRHGITVVRADLAAADRMVRDGLPVTAPGRTVRDCIPYLPFPTALDMLDRALQRRVTTLDEIAAYTRAMFGRDGAPQLRRLLRHVIRDADSEAERLLHTLLRRAGIGGWLANEPILDEQGHLLGVGDIVFFDARLVIEVDGRRWHGAEGNRFQRDRTRQNALVQAGYRVLRFTWYDLTRRPGYVVATVRRMLDS